MPQFKEVDLETVILYRRGVYRQLKLYTLDGLLFAGNGSTFVRLYKGGSTSSDAKWTLIDGSHYEYDGRGQLKLPSM